MESFNNHDENKSIYLYVQCTYSLLNKHYSKTMVPLVEQELFYLSGAHEFTADS